MVDIIIQIHKRAVMAQPTSIIQLVMLENKVKVGLEMK